MRVEGLYAGKAMPFGPAGEPSAIRKTPVEQVVVTTLGIRTDEQADRRYHGGPDKALHQYAQTSYTQITAAFPALARHPVPGSMGENLSIPGMDDENTCIGDIYRMGSVEVQVSEPRMPCWKISQLFDEKKLLRLILRRPITGWYFRVLRPGALVIGDPVKRVYRPSNSLSIADLVRLDQARQPQAVQLHRAAATEGLNEDWRQRLRQRAEKAVRP